MTKDEILEAAQRVVKAHIRAINSGDREAMRRQLVGSHREQPFRFYCDAMMELRPLEILSLELSEPEFVTKPPNPRACSRATVDLASGGQRAREEFPIWIPIESATPLIAGRISMRRK